MVCYCKKGIELHKGVEMDTAQLLLSSRSSMIDNLRLVAEARGEAWEIELFGFSQIGLFHSLPLPKKLSKRRSMQEIIDRPLALIYEEDVEPYSYYNPQLPNWGRIGELWDEVRVRLPRKVNKTRSKPLSLYIAAGNTSMDIHYGVDAFFLWEDIYVTLDASTSFKLEHKANLVVTPCDMTEDGVCIIANKIASLLIKRRHIKRRQEEKKRRNKLHN